MTVAEVDYPEQWAALDRMDVDPRDVGHKGMLADLLMCNRNRIDDAVAAVGPNVGKIRRWLSTQPRPEPKPSRWRGRRYNAASEAAKQVQAQQ